MKISELENGKNIEMILLLAQSTKMSFKNKEGYFLSLNLQDISGVIQGKIWEVTSEMDIIHDKVTAKNGVYVKVNGLVNEYKGQLQLTVNSMVEVPPEEINPKDFMPTLDTEKRKMLNQKIKDKVNEIADKEYKALLIGIFKEKDILTKYVCGIGGVKMHHNYIGGLIEHSLEVVDLALSAQKVFPELDPSLLITGGILHDIGKIEEYEFSKSFSFNPVSIEHRYAGIGIIDRVIERKNINISPEKLHALKNIIVSHHGDYSYDKTQFATPEAIIIHSADVMSAHVNGELIKQDRLGIPFGELEEK